jgi:hypothetical protein
VGTGTTYLIPKGDIGHVTVLARPILVTLASELRISGKGRYALLAFSPLLLNTAPLVDQSSG